MSSYIESKKANCKNCYKCIRHCPVKSIRFSNNQAQIVEDECILCGRCYVVCPQGVKGVKNDIARVKEMLAGEAPVYVSIAPSFIANFENSSFASIRSALMKIGFAEVEETAIGATIVKNEYERLIEENPEQVLISSCCHSINTLIQKRYPEALPMLAHVDSPMLAHCKKMKKEHPEIKTVFIGPCISKKEEADKYPGIVDAVLTFEELAGWFEDEEVTVEYEKDTCEEGHARLFPTTGGIVRSMMNHREGHSYISIDGVKNCMRALDDIIKGELKGCFIEMSACIGSCVGGPAMSKEKRQPISDVMKVNEFAGEEDFTIKGIEDMDFEKNISYLGTKQTLPGTAAIEDILRQMGKQTKEDELNCGSCGYDTCRDKAVAVYLGKADMNMCLPFLKERAESFSDNIIGNTPNGIIVLNSELEVQQINKAACRMLNVARPADILNCPVVRILDPIDFLTVANTKQSIHDKRIYLAEYEKYMEETVLYDKGYDIVIIILRDVTEEERQLRQKESISMHTVEITDKVIEKQMRVCQEIASLLGETTAETKIALSKLKETLENE